MEVGPEDAWRIFAVETCVGVRLLWMYVCMYVCMSCMYLYIYIYGFILFYPLRKQFWYACCIDPLLDHILARFLKFGLAEECAPSSCRMDMFRKIVFNLEQTHRNRMAQYPT